MQISGRPRRRFSTGAILLATSLGVVLASRAPAAQTTPAEAAFEECRVLMTMEVRNQAIARCEEAARLDPKLPDPYFLLGAAHEALAHEEAGAATPDDSRIQEHRRKATENYKKFLNLNRGDTEPRRRARPKALGGLLGVYISGDERDEAILQYANQLAEEPSLGRRELFFLAAVYSRHERPELSEKFIKRQLDADPSDAEACLALAQYYNEPVWNGRPRFDDSIGTLERCAAQNPSDPVGYYRLATFLWDKAYRDQTLTDKQKLVYVERGLAHIDRALALKKDLWEALIYKGLLLRLKAMAVSDQTLQRRLVDEAGALQKRALALKAAGVPPHPGLATGMWPPPPPPTPPRGVVGGVVGGIPGGAIRVGGQIKEPKKLKDVPPDYPNIAKQARVQGVVILECTISPQGAVVDVKVLRGIPLLDQAAIDAVKQWVYEPTGIPVPLIMTVTVTFTLS